MSLAPWPEPCKDCGGSGHAICQDCNDTGINRGGEDCSSCALEQPECPRCQGTGDEPQKIDKRDPSVSQAIEDIQEDESIPF